MKPRRGRIFGLFDILAVASMAAILACKSPLRTATELDALELEVAGVRLLDPASAGLILRQGEGVETFGMTSYTFANADRSETITFVQHPGDVGFSIAEVEIEHGRSSASVPEFPRPVVQFLSPRGVKLGMDRESVVELLGPPTSESELEVRYVHGGELVLERFNLPAYESVYRFKDGRLVRFGFGFPYP